MEKIGRSAVSLLTFAFLAGGMEMVLPEGGMRRSAEALIALLAAKLILETAIGLFAG